MEGVRASHGGWEYAPREWSKLKTDAHGSRQKPMCTAGSLCAAGSLYAGGSLCAAGSLCWFCDNHGEIELGDYSCVEFSPCIPNRLPCELS